MSNVNAIPGMASYMETEVDVEVSVGAPEEVAVEAEETAAEAVEVEEATTEADDDAAAAEQMFAHFDNIARLETYVSTYGVDRAFLALNNYEGSLASALVVLPQCEGFDVTGDIASPISVACQEGFKEAAKSVWEFIKRMAEKIKNFVMRIVEAIKARFTSLDKNIGRYREAMKTRTDAPELLKGVKTTVYTKEQLAAINAKNDKTVADKLKKVAEDLKKLADQVQAGKKTEAEAEAKAIETALSAITSAGDAFKKQRGAAKKVQLDKIKWEDCTAMLNAGAAIKQELDIMAGISATAKVAAEQFIKMADGMKNRGDEGGAELASIARKGSSLFSRFSSAYSGFVSQANWMAAKYVETAGVRIMRGSKGGSKD